MELDQVLQEVEDSMMQIQGVLITDSPELNQRPGTTSKQEIPVTMVEEEVQTYKSPTILGTIGMVEVDKGIQEVDEVDILEGDLVAQTIPATILEIEGNPTETIAHPQEVEASGRLEVASLMEGVAEEVFNRILIQVEQDHQEAIAVL